MLNPNRNPHYTKQEHERFLTQTFGLKRILWLHHGYLAGDDTDSHIDTLARFVDDNTIMYVTCNDTFDNYMIDFWNKSIRKNDTVFPLFSTLSPSMGES